MAVSLGSIIDDSGQPRLVLTRAYHSRRFSAIYRTGRSDAHENLFRSDKIHGRSREAQIAQPVPSWIMCRPQLLARLPLQRPYWTEAGQ